MYFGSCLLEGLCLTITVERPFPPSAREVLSLSPKTPIPNNFSEFGINMPRIEASKVFDVNEVFVVALKRDTEEGNWPTRL